MSNNLNEEMSEMVETEFEVLKAIYLEDISIEMNERSKQLLASIAVNLYPKTGDSCDQQFVKLMLVIDIPKNYPNISPVFHFKNIRGLTENMINEITSQIKLVLEEKKSETVVYHMIERSRDVLTTLNSPVGNRCAICLYELTATDQVLRNECFHHLHCRCFADYVVSIKTHNFLESTQKRGESESELQIKCPVCRTQLKSINWRDYCHPNKFLMPFLSGKPLENESLIIEETKSRQKGFEKIYEKQLKNGGIIDSQTQRNIVLSISQTNERTNVSSIFNIQSINLFNK